MYAVIETGGKQYKVKEGDVIKVEKLNLDEGSDIVFDKVLLFNDNNAIKLGYPYLDDVNVKGSIIDNGKDKKIIVYKYKPKKNYRRKQGHRQPFSKVKIEKIEA